MKDSKQNILLVHNYYKIPGGEDTVVKNEAELLRKHGHKVILYSRNNTETESFGIIRKVLLPFTSVFSLKTYREIKKLICTEEIEIVHVHNTVHLISPSVYYAALRCKVPVIQTVHNFRLLCPAATFYRDGHICEDCVKHGLKCAIKHSCYRKSKLQTLSSVICMKVHRMTGIYKKIHYICLTEFNKGKLLSLKQVKKENVYVKPNFVSEAKEIIPYDKRKNQFVFAGRLDKLKGIDILLKAWKEMGNNAPRLIVCGTGPMEEWCKEYISENRLNVEMKGFISNEEARKLIANSKAMILPTQWYEGFPMTIVEAYSVGTPVIGSNIGNVGSVVEEGVSGCKFKCNSKEELIEAVKRCKGLYVSTLGEYRKKYTEYINYEMIKDIYSRVL